MPLAPVSRLKKKEIVWLANHRCKHRHTYLEHYECFLKECSDCEIPRDSNIPIPHRTGFFDIETSNLNADYGIILAYCIWNDATKNMLERVITPKELRSCFDEKVVSQCVEDLKHFDRVVTHYGSRFDTKFVRTRAMILGVPFPGYQELLHTDTYYMVRNKFKLHSNRLENACNVLLGNSTKTKIDPLHWNRAMTGDESALEYILDHCRRDVKDLARLYRKIENFTMRRDASI